MAASGDAVPEASWSSTLSVAEMSAIHQAGFSPLGLVLGSSVYRVGVDWSPNDYYSYANTGAGFAGGVAGGGFGGMGGSWAGRASGFPGWTKYYNRGGWAGSPIGLSGMANFGVVALCWERTVLESGVEEAASLAMARLLEETRRLGGHGVIGTRLNFRWMEGMTSTVEFTAIGTAVVRPGAALRGHPFTSHLDGQALLKLLRAGMAPVKVGVGVGAVTASVPTLSVTGSAEVTPFGDAIEASRRIAADHLRASAGGSGWAVLGTLASVSMEGETAGRTMTTVLTGTAVERVAPERRDPLPLPLPIMRLSKP